MRVYEFSKKFGISNKEIIKILQGGGFDIQNHMAMLNQESMEFLQKKLSKAPNKEVEKIKKVVPKPEIQPQEQPVAFEPTETKVIEKKVMPIEQKTKQFKKEELPEEAKKELILRAMSLGELADYLNKPVSELILSLLKKGLMYNKNQILPEDLVEQLAKQSGVEVIKSKQKISPLISEAEPVVKIGKKLNTRLPIVVVMGHVDHGKTTLLDFIRKTRVAAKEKGGITQHLGAYQVETAHGAIVFLDTPGHAAFSMMRMRGARVADIVILVVAADDGVMPQTVEAIKVAQSKNIPIIVAINKADKVDAARIEEIKAQLSKYDLLAEDWGGQTICVPISAKLGQGVDKLLDMILLQAEVLELSADETMDACGYVLESKFEKGLGPVATFISQHGIIKIGDYFICGSVYGRVTVLVDSYGKRVQQAGPSVPVQISGLSELPQVGDYLQVVSAEEYRKFKANAGTHKTPAALRAIPEEAINIILKTDNDSSKEALLGSIDQFSKKIEKQVYIVFAGVGNINESDVVLALNTNSIIYAFGVKTDGNAALIASQNSISIRFFDIIYKLLDDLQELIKSRQKVEIKRIKTGEAIVRKIFDIKGVGVISGIYVQDGKIVRGGQAVIWRGNKKIGEGQIKSLQRDKKAMKEIAAGFEGAFIIEGFIDWMVEDRVECFIEVPANQ